jgi:hypothetical protein
MLFLVALVAHGRRTFWYSNDGKQIRGAEVLTTDQEYLELPLPA